MISFALAPMRSATCLRAFSTASSAFPAEGVIAARGVAELLREVGQHRLEHPRVDGGVAW
jgi:hypothetical protein